MYNCRIQLCNLKYLYLDARLNMSSDLSLDCVMHETLFDLIPEEILNLDDGIGQYQHRPRAPAGGH